MDWKASLLSLLETADRVRRMAQDLALPLPGLLDVARDLDREAQQLEETLIRTGELAADWRTKDA
jgi:hypothetical protein